MSRFLVKEKDGWKQYIESMEVCKWKIDDICCNDKSICLGDYPYPSKDCEHEGRCPLFEKEDGVI